MSTPFDDLFAALEERMGVPVGTDADPSQRSRVVWSRAGAIEPRPAPWRRAGQKTIGRDAHRWKATIYADSDLEACLLLKQFRGHLDILQGPPQGGPAVGVEGDADYVRERPGYEIKAGEIGPRGGDGTAAGYACDVAVTLFDLVASHIHPLATVETVGVTVAADIDDPETGITWTS